MCPFRYISYYFKAERKMGKPPIGGVSHFPSIFANLCYITPRNERKDIYVSQKRLERK